MLTPLPFPGSPGGALSFFLSPSRHHLFGHPFYSHRYRGFLASRLQNGLPTWAPILRQKSSISWDLQDRHPARVQAGLTTLLQNGDPAGLSGRFPACGPGDLQAGLTRRRTRASAAPGALRPVLPTATASCSPCLGATPKRHADQAGAS